LASTGEGNVASNSDRQRQRIPDVLSLLLALRNRHLDRRRGELLEELRVGDRPRLDTGRCSQEIVAGEQVPQGEPAVARGARPDDASHRRAPQRAIR
jgi:hypothetical protein